MHITECEDLTSDRISRLIIREKIEGNNFAIRFEQSDLVVSTSGDRSVQMRCELEDEDVLDFFEANATGVLENYGVDALELECIQIKNNNNYIFPGPVIMLENARAEKGGQSYYLAPDTVPTLAAYFGCVGVPQFNPPTALLVAMTKGSKGTVNKLLKRIRQFPSLYGVADYSPSYYACLGRITAPEERNLRWPI